MLLFLTFSCLSKIVTETEERGFINFMRFYNKYYTGDEYHFRLGIYLTNKRYVDEFNRQNNQFSLSINHLACLSPSEYQALLTGYASPINRLQHGKVSSVRKGDVPDSLDYRDKGVLAPIKDQGNCGSCWAFSSVCAQEAQNALKTGSLLQLSEQCLIDCLSNCRGCDGCNAYIAYNELMERYQGKFMLESEYPYIEGVGQCKFDLAKGVTQLTGMVILENMDEEKMKEQIALNGPASIAIDAVHSSFRLYHDGIYYESKCNPFAFNHLIACIGYGTLDGKDYWIVRNSWGLDWGMAGYCYMSRNCNNNCGVASMTITPTDD